MKNYDVTTVTARNGIDNSTSFRTVNGKKQFIGTPWNETSHITNDANQGTIFSEGQGMTLKLNSRYKNGGADVYSNLDRKHTGISFDLLDKFIEAAANGVLEDVDHQGYTRENMVEFGKAFDELREAKLAEAKKDPYNKKYTRMMNGTEFTFSAEELEKLYKAAGFDLAKKDNGTKPIEIPEVPTVPSTPKEQPVNPVPPTQPSVPPKKPISEGNEPISQSGKQIANEITKALGLPDGEIDLKFNGESLCYEDGKLIYAEGEYTLNGEKRKFKIDRTGEKEVIQTKKPGVFKKWHTVEAAADDKAADKANRAGQATQTVAGIATADKAAAKEDDKAAAKAYKKLVTKAQYWSNATGATKIVDASGNEVTYPAYEKMTINGKRVTRVHEQNEDGSTSIKLYEAKVVADANGKYYAVPDTSKPVTIAKKK